MKLCNKIAPVALAAGAMLLAAGLATPAHALGKLGVLACKVESGAGLLIFSSKRLDCTFTSISGKRTRYSGRITRVGLDIGYTANGVLMWTVLAAGDPGPGALEGGYVGASAEATLGAGVGANALVGGFRRSIVLQPFSVSGQTGGSLALAISGLELRRR